MFNFKSGDLTDGSLSRGLLYLAVPLFAQNIVQVVQQVVDLFWLGQLSGEAVAAVGFSAPVFTLLLLLVVPLPTIGTQVLVSQKVGSEDPSSAQEVTSQGLLFAGIVAVFISVISFVGLDGFISLMTILNPTASTATVLDMSEAYLRVLLFSVLFIALGNVLEGGFIGWGNSRVPLYITVISVATNITLDPILIFGLGPVPTLGIEGAALATVIASVAGFLLGVGFLLSSKYERIVEVSNMTIHLSALLEIVRVGGPRGVQDFSQQVARVGLMVLIFSIGGPGGLAAYIVANRVARMAFIPAYGLQQAVQTAVGQNLGATKPKRATKSVWYGIFFATGGLFILGVLQFVFADSIAGIFIHDRSSDAYQITTIYLKVIAISYPAFGVIYESHGGFNGAGKTRISLISSLFQYWILQLPLAIVVGFVLNFDIIAIFWVETIASVITALILLLYFAYSTRTGLMERVAKELEKEAAGPVTAED